MPAGSIVKRSSPENDSNVNVNVSLHSIIVSSSTVRFVVFWADESIGNRTFCAVWGILG